MCVWKANMEEQQRSCYIQGYHVYSATWEAAIGEEFACDNNENVVWLMIRGWNISFWKYFMCLIFVVIGDYKKILRTKMSRIISALILLTATDTCTYL